MHIVPYISYACVYGYVLDTHWAVQKALQTENNFVNKLIPERFCLEVH